MVSQVLMMQIKIAFDQQEILKRFNNKAEEVLDSFSKFLAGISPYKIDLLKLKSVISNGKTLKEHERDGTILISLNGPRAARIDSIYEGQKIFRAIITSLLENGFLATDNTGSILVSLPQITEDIRKDIIKKIKTSKEEYKVRINTIRGEFHKEIKSLAGISEDLQHSLKSDIDKNKTTYADRIEIEFTKKEHEVLRG